MRISQAFAFICSGVFAVSAASADPITFTLTSIATGTLGGIEFTNAAITVTSLADTSQVSLAGSTYEVIAGSSSISIAGFQTATFTDPTFWEDPQGSGDIAFADGTLGDWLLGFDNPVSGLVSYNLQSSFGPLSGSSDWTSFLDGFQNISTSAGSLSLVASNDTFTAATDSPEPVSFLLAGLGLLAVFVVRATAKSFNS